MSFQVIGRAENGEITLSSKLVFSACAFQDVNITGSVADGKSKNFATGREKRVS
jgi:hypothetical protein